MDKYLRTVMRRRRKIAIYCICHRSAQLQAKEGFFDNEVTIYTFAATHLLMEMDMCLAEAGERRRAA